MTSPEIIGEMAVILHQEQKLKTNTNTKHMKTITLNIASILILALTANTALFAQIQDGTTTTIEATESNDTISSVRAELAARGYEIDVMNELFGNENFNFPTNEQELETSMYIIGLLIDNDQFEEDDKKFLEKLVNEAYALYVESTTLTEIK